MQLRGRGIGLHHGEVDQQSFGVVHGLGHQHGVEAAVERGAVARFELPRLGARALDRTRLHGKHDGAQGNGHRQHGSPFDQLGLGVCVAGKHHVRRLPDQHDQRKVVQPGGDHVARFMINGAAHRLHVLAPFGLVLDQPVDVDFLAKADLAPHLPRAVDAVQAEHAHHGALVFATREIQRERGGVDHGHDQAVELAAGRRQASRHRDHPAATGADVQRLGDVYLGAVGRAQAGPFPPHVGRDGHRGSADVHVAAVDHPAFGVQHHHGQRQSVGQQAVAAHGGQRPP